MQKNVWMKLMCAVAAGSLMLGCMGMSAAAEERETVDFWYLWSGDGESGASNIEAIIDAYNASQDKYEVVGLSVPDMQKIITAISGGEGPDITDAFQTNIPNYAEENIAMCLDDFIAADNLDLSVLVDDAVTMNQYDGKQYALPINCNTYVLYYNKDLLEAAGYTEAPKTMEELFEMGLAMTKIENGEVTQMGLPIIGDMWLDLLTYSAGGDFGTPEEVSLVNEGVEKALTLVSDSISELDLDALNAYVSSAKSMWWGAEDYFRSGEGAFRFDGPWFYKMAVNSGINVGTVTIPAFEDQGDQRYTRYETSNLYIPSTADCTEGAWDFMKFFAMGEGAKQFAVTDGSLPALNNLFEDEDVIATFDPDKATLSTLSDVKLMAMPGRVDSSECSAAKAIAMDSIVLGESVEDVIAELQSTQDACN